MKTKLFISCACVVLACAGCLEKADDVTAAKSERIEAVETLTDFMVPVKDGMATIVKLDGETLAVSHLAETITVPRWAVAENKLEITYSDDAIYDNFSSAEWWQYISFEDTRNGDYDYNDLVIHARINVTGKYNNGTWTYKHAVAVQPVALGSAVALKLGILYKETPDASQLSERILCENVRKELFAGNPIFPINTDASAEKKKVSDILTPFFEMTNSDKEGFKVVWFIENQDGVRLYAATTNFGADKTLDMISPDGLPYGISLTKKWDYPVEKCHIKDAYPGFYNWIQNGNETTLLGTPVRQNLYPAIRRNTGDFDLWDYTK